MKFLILNTNYPESILWLYTQNPGLESLPYAKHVEAYLKWMPGTTYFYAMNLRKLGHEAYVVVANNEFAQKAWAREHGIHLREPLQTSRGWMYAIQQIRRLVLRFPIRYLNRFFRPALRVLASKQHWFYDILAAQIEYYRPDVVLNLAMDSISTSFLAAMKPYVKLMVGEGDAALPLERDYGCYDLIRCSLPHHVQFFKQKGIPCELYRFGFEPEILDRVRDSGRPIPISFVGSLSSAHGRRIALLEALCAEFGVKIKIWAPKSHVDRLPPNSIIRQCYVGPSWGFETYRILRNSKITLNCQIDSAGRFADNIRLYEATGLGALLVTDHKENLSELFVIGEEIVSYKNLQECAELIRYYLEHDEERERIARAGQARTLREHTYYQRMQELVEIVSSYVKWGILQ